MSEAILVLNAGSSSLKFSVYINRTDDCELFLRGKIEGLRRSPRFVAYDAERNTIGHHEWEQGTSLHHDDAIRYLFEWGQEGHISSHQIEAVGHRVGHGGLEFTEPLLVDSEVMSRLEELTPLAPLHQPHNLSAIRAVAQDAPDLPQVACFDTSFHRDHRFEEDVFALPRSLTESGICRYGFHGLSYEYIASRLADFDPRAAEGSTVVAHLGSGVSLCALRCCRSIATTMSFTALDGLPMGTRCGSLDPGVLLYLIDQRGMGPRELEHLLYNESGLLGISEISNDMRVLLQSDDPRAAEAVDYFVYRIGRQLGSLAAAAGGLDAIVFTAGIGENSAAIRARVCEGAAWLGLKLDEDANQAGEPRISRPESAVTAWVIPTNEELMIARHTRRVLAGDKGG